MTWSAKHRIRCLSAIKSLICLTFLCFYIAGIGEAQEIEYLSSILHCGEIESIVASGEYAYCSTRSYMLVLDISDPTAPVFVRAIPEFRGDRTILKGNYIYSARYYDDATEVLIIDISTPGFPTLAARLPGSAHDIYIDSTLAYIACSGLGLKIVDVTDPYSPQILSSIESNDMAKGVAVSGDYAYIADFDTGLTVINVADPYAPFFVSNCSGNGRFIGIAVSGQYAFVTSGYSDVDLYVYDIADPISPQYIGGLILPTGAADGIFIEGNYAFVNHSSLGWGAVYIIDISDPVHPEIYSQYDSVGYPRAVFKADSSLFISGLNRFGQAGSYGLVHILNIADLSRPVLRGTYRESPNASVDNFSVCGDYVYTGGYLLNVIDISNPAAPSVIGQLATYDPEDIWALGDYLYLLNYGALRVYSIANRTEPQLMGYCYMQSMPIDFFIEYPYAYIVDERRGIVIVDISDPAQPDSVGSYLAQEYLDYVAVDGNYAYIIENHVGLLVLDITNPANPTYYGHLNLNDYYFGITIDGGYAYLSSSMLYIVDISAGPDPVLAGTFDPQGGYVTGAAVSNGLAFIITQSPGTIRMVDVSNPQEPIELASYSHVNTRSNIAVQGELIFANIASSLAIFRYSMTGIEPLEIPAQFVLLPPYPNPFNSSTTISYSLPSSDLVTIDIYDILGRKITRLFSGNQLAGEHRATWDAAGIPSGLYFARLESGEGIEAVKMLLLK
jgi:hypothetical protein